MSSSKKPLIPALLILYCFAVVIVDVLTNAVWPALFFLPLLASPWLFGFAQTLILLLVIAFGVSLGKYVEHLHETLSGADVHLFSSLGGRLLVAIVAFGVLGLWPHVLFPSLRSFFARMWRMISLPGVRSALAHMLISYVAIAFAFAIIYASLYAFVDRSMFAIKTQIQLGEFFMYSAFVPVAFSFTGISPTHWVSQVLTFFEFLFGLSMVVIYMGALVSEISSALAKDRDA
jgi:hypothetical protein